MSAENTTNPVVSEPGSPLDVVAQLGRFRERALELDGHDSIAELLDPLVGSLEQVMEEHRGMADELISAYEQLGIVFEVTRNLPAVKTEVEVLQLFLGSLRRTFGGCTIVSATRDAGQCWVCDGEVDLPRDWLEAMLEQASQSSTVSVETPSLEGTGTYAETLLAPICAGEYQFGMIVLARQNDAQPFRASDMLIIESLANFCGDLIRTHRLAREMSELSVQMVRALVNAVDQKDEYTSGHSLRVAHFATKLGRALSLRGKELQMLQWGALLHDVGKIGIRDAVLNKPGRLTPEEFDHIKEHPVRSYKVVRAVPQLADALDGILYHHEHYDGGGYPEGLAGECIPRHARIIQIADIFDALTSNRSYRKAYTWWEALEILAKEAGRTVDPNLLPIFDRTMRKELEGSASAWVKMVQEADYFSHPHHDDPCSEAGT